MSSLDELNTLSSAEAALALRRCCGAARWVERMLALRPYASAEDLLEKAEQAAARLKREDWLEAFTHHPRIGDMDRLRERFGSTAAWSSGEQSGVNAAAEQTLLALKEGNDAYFEKFGYIFIVCATGKTAGEMLTLLQARLPNSPDAELPLAAAEQRKITRIRLEKLLAS